MRFRVDHPPIPRDAIYDSALDDGACAATVPVGHAQAWIDGAEYEHDRIMGLLVEAGMSSAIRLVSA